MNCAGAECCFKKCTMNCAGAQHKLLCVQDKMEFAYPVGSGIHPEPEHDSSCNNVGKLNKLNFIY